MLNSGQRAKACGAKRKQKEAKSMIKKGRYERRRRESEKITEQGVIVLWMWCNEIDGICVYAGFLSIGALKLTLEATESRLIH